MSNKTANSATSKTYECTVTLTYNDTDDYYNRPRSREEVVIVADEDIDVLYRALGLYKAQETVAEQRNMGLDDTYTEVDFSEIREIIVVSTAPVDTIRLLATPAMQALEEKRQQKLRAIQEEKARQDAEKAAKKAAGEKAKVAKEKAELARLMRKYSI